MYGVDMTKPGAQEYYDSVFALIASWDLDYVKVDDLSRPYHKDEIEAIRKAIDRYGRPIVFSTSPGATPVTEGEHVETHANLWRISNDFWDDWRAFTRSSPGWTVGLPSAAPVIGPMQTCCRWATSERMADAGQLDALHPGRGVHAHDPLVHRSLAVDLGRQPPGKR